MSFREITHCAQRLEKMEERAGIEIRGLMITVEEVEDRATDDEYIVNILGEITATNGSTINNDIEITVNCYNSNRQVCGTTTVYLYLEDFFGLDRDSKRGDLCQRLPGRNQNNSKDRTVRANLACEVL